MRKFVIVVLFFMASVGAQEFLIECPLAALNALTSRVFDKWNSATGGHFEPAYTGYIFYANLSVNFTLGVDEGELVPAAYGSGLQINLNPMLDDRTLEATLTRLIGAALGMPESTEPDSVMNADTKNIFLSLADTDALRALYGLDPVADTLAIYVDTTIKPYNGKGGRFSFLVSEPIGFPVHWDFGDGTSGTSPRVFHHFKKRGRYHITAIAAGYTGTLDLLVK